MGNRHEVKQMNKFPFMCKLFGHKFIANITHTNLWTDMSYKYDLKFPFCKRCGLSREEIAKATADNYGFKKGS